MPLLTALTQVSHIFFICYAIRCYSEYNGLRLFGMYDMRSVTNGNDILPNPIPLASRKGKVWWNQGIEYLNRKFFCKHIASNNYKRMIEEPRFVLWKDTLLSIYFTAMTWKIIHYL